MATITLKNVPEDLYERLKESAARNRRSLNQEAIFRLAESTPREQRDPQEVLEELRRFRARLPRKFDVPIDVIDRWKREGRE